MSGIQVRVVLILLRCHQLDTRLTVPTILTADKQGLAIQARRREGPKQAAKTAASAPTVSIKPTDRSRVRISMLTRSSSRRSAPPQLKLPPLLRGELASPFLADKESRQLLAQSKRVGSLLLKQEEQELQQIEQHAQELLDQQHK